MLPNKVYDVLRMFTIIIPAVGTFYFALAEIWNLPYGEQVTATCAAATALLAALLKISSVKYAKSLEEEGEDD